MSLKPIKFKAVAGDRTTSVMISPMLGLTSFHLYEDNYYLGSFNKMLQGWHFYGNEPGEAALTTADREILLDMVLEYLEKLEP